MFEFNEDYVIDLINEHRELGAANQVNSKTIAVIVVLAILCSMPVVFFLYSACVMGTNKHLKLVLGRAIFSDEDGENEEELPPPPKVLCSFRTVKYRVPLSDGSEKRILQGVSAYFEPGTLTAVMGPSGCGKSTLLDILAGQKSFGTISGDIRINGKPRTELFRRATAYVQQFDVLYPNLTAKETFFFVTELRLADKITSAMKYKIVLQTLRDLGIDHVADTRIGDGESGGGLSGGQKRRVTVGIELVTGPGLLFLDEPTSGLDAFGSLELVKVLRKLADDGRTIACTIHQPRADIFELFNNLLLVKFGRTMYFGKISGIFPYFEKFGVKVDYSVNPADFIVDLTRDLSDDEKVEEARLVALINEHRKERGESVESVGGDIKSNDEIDLDKLCEYYDESSLKRKHDKILKQFSSGNYEAMPPLLEDVWANDKASKYSSSFFHQVHFLTIRAVVNDFRNMAYITGHWVIGAVMMLFYGALYSNIAAPDYAVQSSYQLTTNTTSACVLSNSEITQYPGNPTLGNLTACGLPSTQSVQYLFVRISLIYQILSAAYFAENSYVSSMFLEKRMFFREHSSHGYSSGSYHLSWAIRLFFAAGCKGLVLPPCAYFLCKLESNFLAYVIFIFIYGGMSSCGSAFALLCSAAGTSLGVATNVYVLINIVCQNLSGYFIPMAFVGWWFKWFMYMNFYYWAIYGAQMGQLLSLINKLPADTNPFINGVSAADMQTTVSQEAWGVVILILMYAVGIHLVAFLVTFLTYRNSNAVFEDYDEDTVDEEFDIGDERSEKSASMSSTSDGIRAKRKSSRLSLLTAFQQAQQMSTRNNLS